WGPLCQYPCKCPRHGRCHPVHGNCTCDEGWWNPTCSKPCQCVSGGSVGQGCDQLTGRCQCQRGHWGLKCPVTCSCHLSPCNQRTGACECAAGWWGPGCDRPCNCQLSQGSCHPQDGRCWCHPGYRGPSCSQGCEAGTYGSHCKSRCGSCKGGRLCSTTDGACDGCEPGWNGTRCDRRCPPGYYGDGCQLRCPRCRGNEPCDPVSGTCGRCEPGWSGPRCQERCTNRTFGDACSFLCGPCFHGDCDHVTGRCVCRPGFRGESCNSSCPVLRFGLNCSSTCDCGEGVHCSPVTGACPSSRHLFTTTYTLSLPLSLPYHSNLNHPLSPYKIQTKYISSSSSLNTLHIHLTHSSSYLPSTPFNHSFIEPPSSGWVTEGSSFDSDEEEGEALYCVPPREGKKDIEAVAGGEFQEMASKCNMFLDPCGFSSEDISSPFDIPRTSSIAKSKRPSVSFAEGTRFSPKERRGSAQESKPKPSSAGALVPGLQSQGEDETDETEREDGREGNTPESQESVDERRRTRSNQLRSPEAAAGNADKVTTVYVTLGKAGRAGWKAELNTEGPVQAMLRRLGSLQRQREQQNPGRNRPRATDGVSKPPRKKL
uniref:Scavenger receptor class F member 1 n=1 Tax=Tetraodon nigroviridis TaxID=99883 RepID=H3DQM4_TETNG